jgi:putative ABC transport system permease protein
VLMSAAGFALLVVCSNIANLATVRLLKRERELAARVCFGAGRMRVLRQLLTETLLLSFFAGGLALVPTAWTRGLLIEFASRFSARAVEVRCDWVVVVFTVALSLAIGMTLGILPVFGLRRDILSALRETSCALHPSNKRNFFRTVSVISQVCVSFVLLTSAGLMMRSLDNLRHIDGGFNRDHVLTARMYSNWNAAKNMRQTHACPGCIYHSDTAPFYDQMAHRLETLPHVESVGLASTFPLYPRGSIPGIPLQFQGEAPRDARDGGVAELRVVSPDYFRTLGITILAGRNFSESDDLETARVGIVNRHFVRRHSFNDLDLIGKRLSYDRAGQWLTIVGVAQDVRQHGLDKDSCDELYIPFKQMPIGGASVLLRTRIDPLTFASEVRRIAHEIDPDTVVTDIRTMEEVLNESLAPQRKTTWLLLFFAGLALIITATGIGGLLAVSVHLSDHEVALRMALGASRYQVLRLVFRQGVLWVIAGLGLGILVTFSLDHLISGLLFQVKLTDPVTLTVAAVVLLSMAAMACYVPARRATSINPMTTLRAE